MKVLGVILLAELFFLLGFCAHALCVSAKDNWRDRDDL
jgi:hypothetical protein